MSLPTYLRAHLDEVNGNNCGTLTHRLIRDTAAPKPLWTSTGQSGDFAYAQVAAVLDANDDMVDYECSIIYISFGSNCHGSHKFHLSSGPVSPPANPVGDYCMGSSGSTNCSNGKAHVTDDD